MRVFKEVKVVLIILLMLTWIVAGVGFVMLEKGSTKESQEKQEEIEKLQTRLDAVSELTQVYALVGEVESGQKLETTDYKVVEVPIEVAGTLVGKKEKLEGKYYKLGLKEGTLLTEDMLYEEELTRDMRLLDVVTSINPVGLKEGKFVDIRIKLPLGDDYVAIAHRKVKELNSSILKLVATEQDIHTYNSMLVDMVMYPGTQIYAVEYVEGAVQESAEVYYPASKNILAIAQKDPNYLQEIQKDMIKRREHLEVGIGEVRLSEKEQENLTKLIQSTRDKEIGRLLTAQKEVDKERAEFEAQHKKEKARLERE